MFTRYYCITNAKFYSIELGIYCVEFYMSIVFFGLSSVVISSAIGNLLEDENSVTEEKLAHHPLQFVSLENKHIT